MNDICPERLGDKYIILDLIGIGGMAKVYRSKLVGHKGFEKLIVLKIMLPHIAAKKELIEQFTAEARLAALLQHENIAYIYDFGEIDSTYFIAMEYLAGKDLYTVMKAAHSIPLPLKTEYALMIASKICEGMDYAHSLKDLHNRPLNIIHRDLSPHNIFITYNGKIKIIDFGIAKTELYDNITKDGVVKGKITYMSPEQIAGKKIDYRSDIFSIGILLYEMISGKRMYSGDTATLIKKAINVEYDHLEKVAPGLQQELYAILHKALACDVNKRYQTCAEMSADINDCLKKMSARPDSKGLQNYIRELFRSEYDAEQEKAINVMNIENSEAGHSEGDKTLLAEAEAEKQNGQSDIIQYSEESDPESAFKTRQNVTRVQKPQPSTGKLLNKSLGVFISSITLITLIFFIFFVKKDKKVETFLPQSGPVKEDILSDSSRQIKNEPEHLTFLGNEKRISDLIASAKRAVEANNLTTPKDDNALKYYHDILAIDNENSFARNGIKEIADHYADLAEKAFINEKDSDAKKLIADGLSAFPEHERLKTLEILMDKKNSISIREYAAKAERAFEKDQLTTPTDDCAWKYYKEILIIDKDNKLAENGLNKIGERYAVLADNAYRKFRIDQAKDYVNKGLQVVPENKSLQKLQADLSKSQPEILFKGIKKNINLFFSKKE